MPRRRNNYNSRTTRKAYPRWTPGEEDILIDEIGKNPTNLKASFFAASEIIGRTPGAISGHYYQKMVGNPDVMAVLTVGRHSVVQNRKRLKEDQAPVNILKSSWDFIVSLLFKK